MNEVPSLIRPRHAALPRWALITLSLVAFTGCGGEEAGPAPATWPDDEPIERSEETAVVRRIAPGPQQAIAARPGSLDDARARLGTGLVEDTCGPYPLLTDADDRALLDSCTRLATVLDQAYRTRYGIAPRGRPAATIVLFTRQRDFRSFASDRGLAAGYAALTRATEGFLALYRGEQGRRAVLRTLVHELTHLVNRRAIGPDLPRWLSEGLSDGLGDTASEGGELLPLTGVEGSEGEAKRLALAYGENRVVSLRRLLTLEDDAFDRQAVSYDYEQSAMVVRFLLAEPARAGAFRAFLAELATKETYDAERLRTALGVSWSALDRDFESWLARSSR